MVRPTSSPGGFDPIGMSTIQSHKNRSPSTCRIQSLGKERRNQLLEWSYGIRERPAGAKLHSNHCGIHQPAGIRQRRPYVWYHERTPGRDNRTSNLGVLVRRSFYVSFGLS